jgi:5-methylthioadenosine/S-adenosylhomocysteine deaminase
MTEAAELAVPDCDLLFNGGTVLCMDSALSVHDPGWVAVKDGRIAGVGPGIPVAAAFQPPDGVGDRNVAATVEIDCSGCIVLPGLINCHTHLPMVAFRGMADDLPLMEWLTQHIWPAEARLLSPDFCHAASLLAAAECIRGGVSCVNDMYLFEDSVAQAWASAGLRGIFSEGVINYPTPSAPDWLAGKRLSEQLIADWAGHPLIEAGVACHAPYSCTPELLQSMHALAVEQGALFHIHLHETEGEPGQIDWLRDGETPTAGLARLGLLGPRTLAAHCVWCDADDIALLAQQGCGVVHDPQSNLKLASGVMPLTAMLEAGVAVGVATDGAASNNNLNLWEELQLAALLAKGASSLLKPRAVPAWQAVALATRDAARALGRSDIGSLAPGLRADICVVDCTAPHLQPRWPGAHSAYAQLAYGAQASDVRELCVEGRLLMRERALLTLDAADCVARVQALL